MRKYILRERIVVRCWESEK